MPLIESKDQGKVIYFMLKKLSVAVTVILFALTSVTLAQTLQNLVHQPPNGAYLPFLLTDGTVDVPGQQLGHLVQADT